MMNARTLADFLLCRENDSPGFIYARESMSEYRWGEPVDWETLALFLLSDDEIPLASMLAVGLLNIWNESLALKAH